ncbi:MAG: hypothetical protein AB1918_07875 [Pseudomonadota bacterium]
MNSILNTAGVRVVDPILTTHVQGYRHPGNVGHLLFPRVPVGVSGGQVLEFGKESFKLYNARRAPGTDTKRIQFGYAGKPFALKQDALEAAVPREWMRDASKIPGIDLARRAVNVVQGAIELGRENEKASIATDAANYDANHKLALAGGDKWSADTGKPVKDITDGKEAVRATIGVRPNTLVLSPLAWNAARENPSVIERFKFTTPGPITLEQFAKLVEIETIVVGEAVYADDAGDFHDVWGNAAVLAYVPRASEGMEQPSYGYTYTMEGHPSVEKPYWDDRAKSWVYGVTNEDAPLLTGMVAGFLFQDPA